MKYIKVLWFDIRQGLLKRPLLLLVPVGITLIACFDLTRLAAQLEVRLPGFGDYLMYLYGGMDRYTPYSGEFFLFPVRWLILFLSAAFLTLHYPYKDLLSCGQQVLIRTRSRTAWWLSKCGWNILSVLVYHGLIFLTAALFCIATAADLSGKFHPKLLYAVFQTNPANQMQDSARWPFILLLLPVLVSLGIGLLQMTLSLFLKPLFSFFLIALLMISSAYFTSSCLVGNYAMAMRYDVVIHNGINFKDGIVVFAVMAFLAILTGCIRFRRYDILK